MHVYVSRVYCSLSVEVLSLLPREKSVLETQIQTHSFFQSKTKRTNQSTLKKVFSFLLKMLDRKWKSVSWARRFAPAKKNIVTKWVLPSVTEAWEKFSLTSFVFSRERTKEYEKSIWQLKRNVSNAWRTRSWGLRLDDACSLNETIAQTPTSRSPICIMYTRVTKTFNNIGSNKP